MTDSVERQPVFLFGPTDRAPVPGPPGLVAVLSRQWMWAAALPPLVRVLQSLPEGSAFTFQCDATTIAAKRNSSVRILLEHPALAWLCFLDDDMTPPPDTIARLLAWDQPVVGALMCKRSPPYEICAGRWANDDPKDYSNYPIPALQTDTPPLLAVDWVGTGCLLIRRPVLEAGWVGDPAWFAAAADDMQEDLRFCRKARQAGFSVHVDTTLRVGHLGLQALVAVDPRSATP